MNEVKYSSYVLDLKLKLMEYTEKYSKRAAIHEFTVP